MMKMLMMLMAAVMGMMMIVVMAVFIIGKNLRWSYCCCQLVLGKLGPGQLGLQTKSANARDLEIPGTLH